MGAGDRAALPAALRLQMLTTEHWSLLATRSMSWNEAFSRSAMFLSVLSGATVALALVAQATSFGENFSLFAVLLLPVVLFVGVTTFIRLVQVNREDAFWVVGMNRLRHAYVELAPDIAPYFVTGASDDVSGLMRTFAANPRSNQFLHGFVTTPGMVGTVVAFIAAVFGAVAGARIGLALSGAIAAGVIVFIASVAIMSWYTVRTLMSLRTELPPRFPAASEPAGRPSS
ncbi:MAG TPA: hypothetical protein VF001_05405 [Candidatus Limnocylindria bacterium]